MADVEILGKPLYCPVKQNLQEEQSPLDQIKSKGSNKPLTYSDIEHVRDEKDWWWCEDV